MVHITVICSYDNTNTINCRSKHRVGLVFVLVTLLVTFSLLPACLTACLPAEPTREKRAPARLRTKQRKKYKSYYYVAGWLVAHVRKIISVSISFQNNSIYAIEVSITGTPYQYVRVVSS